MWTCMVSTSEAEEHRAWAEAAGWSRACVGEEGGRSGACRWMGETERVSECALQWYLHPCTAKSTAPKSTAQEWERAQQCQWVSKHLQQGRKESCKLCIVETKACIKDLTYEGGRDVSHTFANGGGGGIATYINVVGIYVVGRGVVFHWLQDHSRMIVYSAKQSRFRTKTLCCLLYEWWTVSYATGFLKIKALQWNHSELSQGEPHETSCSGHISPQNQ